MGSEGDAPCFLVHRSGDRVGVAVRDLSPGTAQGAYLLGSTSVSVELAEEVPLGHKLALEEIAAGENIVEYGVPVGVASQHIGRGHYVHVHNVRSARWQTSVA